MDNSSSDESAKYNVSGRSVDLPGDRKVLLGTDQDGKTDSLFIRFVSPEAGETNVQLSPEAMDALVRLYALHLRDLTKEAESWSVAVNKEGEIVCENT